MLQFISLVSENHDLRGQAIEEVLNHLNMEVVGTLSDQPKTSLYSVQEISLPFHGEELRLIVVYSTHLFAKKQTTFQRNLDKQREKLVKAVAELTDAEYSCKQDAEAAWQSWLKKNKGTLFPLVHKLIVTTRPAKRAARGRPKKDEEVKIETVYSLQVEIQAVPVEVIQEEERRLGYFVLATNVKDQTQLPAADVLKEYKQQSSVEMRFKFLKDPAFIDALFLKHPERIEALGYILIMALFIYMTLETRLRLTLEGTPIRLQVAPGYYTNKPTGKQILLLLSRIITVYWYNRDDERWYRDLNCPDEVKKVFDLLHFDPSFYLTVPQSSARAG